MAEPARTTSNTGLGKGLGALLSVVPREDGRSEELRTLAVDSIVPNPRQPRRAFDQKALDALSGSIGERGVLQPVLVRSTPSGKWELIAGERRWRAAQAAGLTDIPAVIRQDDDAVALEVALIENMAREDLNPVEEAKACAALVDELGISKEEVGRKVGRSRAAVSNLIRLLDLPDEAILMLEDGRLTEGHGRALLMAPRHDDRRRLAAEAFSRGWSVRTTEDRARDAAEGKKSTKAAHPDHDAAVGEVLEALESAIEGDVKVTPAGDGCKVTLSFADMQTAAKFTQLLSRGA